MKTSFLFSMFFYFLLTDFMPSHASKFKLVFKDDKSLNLRESNPIKVPNYIQCAAYCLKSSDCIGFVIDTTKTCKRVFEPIEKKECPSGNCIEIGYSVYMHFTSTTVVAATESEPLTSTTVQTSAETETVTSTTVQATTEEKTTTNEVTTISEPEEHHFTDLRLKTDDKCVLNYIDGTPYPFSEAVHIQCAYLEGFSSKEMYYRRTKGTGPVSCDENDIAIELHLNFRNQEMQFLELQCRELDQNWMVQRTYTVTMKKNNNSVYCEENGYLNQLETPRIEGDRYNLKMVCVEYDNGMN